MRALSKCGNYLVTFTLRDGPCPVDDHYFVLTERPMSPILSYKNILKGCDIPDLFEGDIIEVDGEEYLVMYVRGMVMESLKDPSNFLPIPGNFKIVSDIYKRGLPEIVRNKPRFKYKDTILILSDILGIFDGKLLINKNGGMLADIEDVKMYAGARDSEKKQLFFGDQNLTLKNGRLVVFKDNQYFDLVKGEIIL